MLSIVTCLYKRKKKTLKLTPLPTPKSAVPVVMYMNDETLPDEIKQLIKERNLESIVPRDKHDSVNANYAITNKQGDKDFYEFFLETNGYVFSELFLLNNYVTFLKSNSFFE